MKTHFRIAAIGLVGAANAAPGYNTTEAASSGAPAPTSSNDYSTMSFNKSAASTYLPNTDYSNERLAFLWDQVGPVVTAAVTTVVEPTPDPSPFPQPNWIHPYVPSYIEGLENATFGDDFIWGVASAGEN